MTRSRKGVLRSGAVMNIARTAEKKALDIFIWLDRGADDSSVTCLDGADEAAVRDGVKDRMNNSFLPSAAPAYLNCTNFSCTPCKRQSCQWVKAFCSSSRPRPPCFLFLIDSLNARNWVRRSFFATESERRSLLPITHIRKSVVLALTKFDSDPFTTETYLRPYNRW